jgi:hypothetical protein
MDNRLEVRDLQDQLSEIWASIQELLSEMQALRELVEMSRPDVQARYSTAAVPLSELFERLPDLLCNESGLAAATCRAYESDFRAFCNFVKEDKR